MVSLSITNKDVPKETYSIHLKETLNLTLLPAPPAMIFFWGYRVPPRRRSRGGPLDPHLLLGRHFLLPPRHPPPMLGPERPEAVLPDRALYLPIFSHLLIVNKLLSLLVWGSIPLLFLVTRVSPYVRRPFPPRRPGEYRNTLSTSCYSTSASSCFPMSCFMLPHVSQDVASARGRTLRGLPYIQRGLPYTQRGLPCSRRPGLAPKTISWPAS